MSLLVANLPRVFRFKSNGEDVSLEDPNVNLPPDEVMTLYSNHYPELTNSNVSGPAIENDKAVYEFKTTIGTKG
jgi:PRTRC genetic system protein C